MALAGLVVAGVVISYLESVEDELAVTVDNESRINKETAELEPRTGETVGQEEKIIVSDTADAPTILEGYSATQMRTKRKISRWHSLKKPNLRSADRDYIGSNGTRDRHGGAGANGFCDRTTRS